MVDGPAWEAAVEAIDAEIDGGLRRAEAAYLAALSRIRQRQAARAQEVVADE